MCAVLSVFSLSLLSGLSHQDYSSILLSFLNTIAKGCVFPLAFSVPNKQLLLCRAPASLLRQRLRKPHPPSCWLSPSVPCPCDKCRDVWSSHLCSVLFLSLTPLRRTPSQKSLLQLFVSLNMKKKKVIVCEIFSLWGSHLHILPPVQPPVCSCFLFFFPLVHIRVVWIAWGVGK